MVDDHTLEKISHSGKRISPSTSSQVRVHVLAFYNLGESYGPKRLQGGNLEERIIGIKTHDIHESCEIAVITNILIN